MDSGQKRGNASYRQQRILVLEKSSLTRQLIADVLNSAGYQVIAPDNFNEALCSVKDEKLDLILTDVNNSVVKLVAHMRENPNSRFTPVALLVDTSDESQKKEGAARINQWIEKPFTPAALLEGVRKFI